MKTQRSVAAKFTKLNNARRAARQAAADFAGNNKPLSQEQVVEHRKLVAIADLAQDACDAFCAENSKTVGGLLRC